MTNSKSFSTTDLDDLIFSGRNRNYGAYELRKNYDYRLGAAFFSTVVVFSLIIILFNNLPGKKQLRPIFPTKPQLRDTGIFVDLKKKIEIDHGSHKHTSGPNPFATLTDDRDTFRDIDKSPLDQVNIGDGKIDNHLVSGDDDGLDPIGSGRAGNLRPDFPKPKAFDSFPDRDAQFPGGFSAFERYLHDNIKYPNFAIESGIHGTISLAMKIDEYGRIADIAVIKGIGYGCDNAAIKAVKEMPRWIPGKKNGENVPVVHRLDIEMILR